MSAAYITEKWRFCYEINFTVGITDDSCDVYLDNLILNGSINWGTCMTDLIYD